MKQDSNLALKPSDSLVASRINQLMHLFPSVNQTVFNNALGSSVDSEDGYPILSWSFIGEGDFARSIEQIIALIKQERKVSFSNLNGLDYAIIAPTPESVKAGCHLMDIKFAEKGLSVVDMVHTYGQTMGGPVWFPVGLYEALTVLLLDNSVLASYQNDYDRSIICAGTKFQLNEKWVSPVLSIDETGGLVLEFIEIEKRSKRHQVLMGCWL